MMLRTATICVFLLASACASAPVEDAPNEGRQVQTIVRNTLSPFCPGKTLDSCPSPRAGEWRRDIHTWVADGVPEPEIRSRLQSRVPDFDLGIPPVKSGWVIPASAVLLSTFWFAWMAWRFTRRRPGKRDAAAGSEDRALDARLDQELATFD